MQDDDLGCVTPRSHVVNIPDDCGYEVKFIHSICLHDTGVPISLINWCQENCIGRWGWHFDRDLSRFYTHPDSHGIAHLSFEIEEDLVLFGLTHDLTYKYSV